MPRNLSASPHSPFPVLKKRLGNGDVGIAQVREYNMYLLRSHNDIKQ
jgi:hypothetical protein